jgi:hypothetical protein
VSCTSISEVVGNKSKEEEEEEETLNDGNKAREEKITKYLKKSFCQGVATGGTCWGFN